MRQLTVLSRSYCHLCDDMVAALDDWRGRFPNVLMFDVVDIELHSAIEQLWGERVPVLLDGDVEICHYFLDVDRLNQHLAQTDEPARQFDRAAVLR